MPRPEAEPVLKLRGLWCMVYGGDSTVLPRVNVSAVRAALAGAVRSGGLGDLAHEGRGFAVIRCSAEPLDDALRISFRLIAETDYHTVSRFHWPLSTPSIPEPVTVAQTAQRARVVIHRHDSTAEFLRYVLGQAVPQQPPAVR